MKNPFHHQIEPTKVFRFQSGLKSVKSMSRMICLIREGYFEKIFNGTASKGQEVKIKMAKNIDFSQQQLTLTSSYCHYFYVFKPGEFSR